MLVKELRKKDTSALIFPEYWDLCYSKATLKAVLHTLKGIVSDLVFDIGVMDEIHCMKNETIKDEVELSKMVDFSFAVSRLASEIFDNVSSLERIRRDGIVCKIFPDVEEN